MEPFQTKSDEEEAESTERVSLHHSHDPAVSRCIRRCAQIQSSTATFSIRTTCSHAARADHGAPFCPTGTRCYPRSPCCRQWNDRPNVCPHYGRSDGGYGCSPRTRWSRCRRSRWCRWCLRHPISDGLDQLSPHFRLLCLSRSTRRRGSRRPPSHSSLPTASQPQPPSQQSSA